MPSDPLEAELLALAGSIDPNDGGLGLDDDSDDSIPDFDDSFVNSSRKMAAMPAATGVTEDIENIMAGSNIVPKALPQITPDSMSNAPNNSVVPSRNNHQQYNLKRRHSGKDAGMCKYFLMTNINLQYMREN